MKIRLLLFLSLILCTGMSSLAQTGSIKGLVSTSDGKPAEYVSVSIKGTNKGSVSGADGKFEIRKVSTGAHALVASFVGFDPIERIVDVRNGEVTTVDFVLNETSAQLEEIVVRGERNGYKVDAPSTSLRLQSSLIETPQNIQVVTGDVLRDQQVISMSDGLIRNVSGVTRSEHWGDLYTNISARGSQIQAFRNGFNVVNSYWGPLTEDMSFVDHIEFVKGPAGFMLSSGDPSGLYNVVTKKPTGISKGEASFTAGSYGLLRTALDLDGKLSSNGKLLYRLNLSAQNKNSHRQNEYNDRYVIAPVISYLLDEKTKLTFEYNYQRANMSNVGSFYVFTKDGFATLPVDFTQLPAGTPGTKIDDHSFYLNLQHEFNENWKITAQASRFLYNQVGQSMWPSAVNQDGTYIRNIGIWDSKSVMSMAQVFVNGEVSTGPIRHRILAGVDMATKEYMADWGQSHDLDTLGAEFDPHNPNLGIPDNGYPKFDRSTPLAERAQTSGGLMDQRYTSLYVQDELGFLENKLRLTVALRYTDLQQSAWGGSPDKGEHVTPRVGFSGSLNKQLSVYALYDQAFIPQTGIMANGGKVQPITGNNMELGIKKDWFGGWNTTLSIYRILKNNELTGDPTNPTSGKSIELGQKRAQGVEFDLRGTIVNGLNLVANYAYTDSRVTEVAEGVTYPEEGSIVPGFAKHTMNAWLNYKLQNGMLKGLGFSAGFTYLMDRATYWEASPDPDKEMENYFKLDAGLFWEMDRIKITANVFNVLDKYLYSGSYESYMTDTASAASPVYSYQTEAPRNARFSVSYKF
ncbi:MAG: TonB-dependent siderophore receptor [Marivirga sp.]|nr:TonB-dependent siderophore receptor [Marivirga sp.]